MKKIYSLITLAALGFCFSGCATVEQQALEYVEQADLAKLGQILEVEEWGEARRQVVINKLREAADRLEALQPN